MSIPQDASPAASENKHALLDGRGGEGPARDYHFGPPRGNRGKSGGQGCRGADWALSKRGRPALDDHAGQYEIWRLMQTGGQIASGVWYDEHR